MLAATAPEDFRKIAYPKLASYKLDGVRAIVLDGVVLSRTLKPIPNRSVQARYGKPNFNGLDGELILGSPTEPDCYRKTVSCVMTEEKDIEGLGLNFHVFDIVDSGLYVDRLHKLQQGMWLSGVKLLEQHHVMGPRDLTDLFEQALTEGYEGLILRDTSAPYKYGRSTPHQEWMLKVKPFVDAEAIVTGFQELYSNLNKPTLDERGYTKRSSHQENQVPQGTLGALLVEFDGINFAIGTGFTAAERREIWDNWPGYIDKLIKFKYLKIGMKDAPRHPVFLGWRDERDT